MGRELLVRSLVGGSEQGRNFVVVGGPASGKTSLLLQIASAFQSRSQRQLDDAKVVPVYLSASQWPKEPIRALAHIFESIRSEVTDAQRGVPVPGLETVELDFGRTRDPLQAFREAMKRLFRALKGTAGFCRFVLLVDDADLLSERSHESYLELILDLYREESIWSPMSVLFCGGRMLRESLRESRSPLRNTRLLTLNVFRDSEAAALLNKGFPAFPERTRTALIHLTGKHPGLMVELLAELEARGGVDEPRDLAREIGQRFEPLFQRIWIEFDMGRRVTYRGAYAAPEHVLFQYALEYRGEISVRVAERELAIRPLKEYAEFLAYVGVAENRISGNGRRLRAGSALFNSWYEARVTQ